MSTNQNELVGEVLFGKVRRKVLSTFVLNPQRSFYLLELIRLLDCGRGAVQREVSRLAKAGILIREKQGNQVHFRADTGNLIYREIRSIFSKTTGLVDLLGHCLESCGDPIGMAFIYGDYARGTAREDSPVDLMVVAPATANIIGKMAAGIADDLLTSVALAFTGRVVVAPAMNACISRLTSGIG